MKYVDFERFFSQKRLNRYVMACYGDKRKAMTLYRYNLRLSQEMFTVICCFEVSLRNAIDSELVPQLGPEWLKDSVMPGGIFTLPYLSEPSPCYIKRIVEDYGLFTIEDTRFTSLWMQQQYGEGASKMRQRCDTPARPYCLRADELKEEIKKENKEKAGSVCPEDTRPPEPSPAAPQPIGPSAYETIDREGLRRHRTSCCAGSRRTRVSTSVCCDSPTHVTTMITMPNRSV